MVTIGRRRASILLDVHFIAGLLVGATLLALPTGAWAQAARQQLLVTVVDANGLGVLDLRAEDFVVTEDGVRREIVRAALATDPMQVAILIDTSEAARPIMREVQEGVAAFVDGIGSSHQLALMTFGGARFVLVNWTSNVEQLKEGATKLRARPGTGSFLPDAVRDTAKDFVERGAARPVLVVVTADGVDHGSHANHRNIIQELRASYTPMYAVLVPTVSRPTRLRWDSLVRDALLSQGPPQTGGRRIELVAGQAVRGALMRLRAELTSQYVVTYARPESLLPPKQLQLGVTRSDVTVRLTPRKPQ